MEYFIASLLIFFKVLLQPVCSCWRKGGLIVFDHDSANRHATKSRSSVQGVLTFSLLGAKFMRNIARDLGFTNYEHIKSEAEPNCCFHILQK